MVSWHLSFSDLLYLLWLSLSPSICCKWLSLKRSSCLALSVDTQLRNPGPTSKKAGPLESMKLERPCWGRGSRRCYRSLWHCRYQLTESQMCESTGLLRTPILDREPTQLTLKSVDSDYLSWALPSLQVCCCWDLRNMIIKSHKEYLTIALWTPHPDNFGFIAFLKNF